MQAVKIQLATLLTFFFLCQLLVGQGVRMSDSFLTRAVISIPVEGACLLTGGNGAGNPYTTENALLRGCVGHYFPSQNAVCLSSKPKKRTVAWIPNGKNWNYFKDESKDGVTVVKLVRAIDKTPEWLNRTLGLEVKSYSKGRRQVILAIPWAYGFLSREVLTFRDDLNDKSEDIGGLIFLGEMSSNNDQYWYKDQWLMERKNTVKSFFERFSVPLDCVTSRQCSVACLYHLSDESILTRFYACPSYSGFGGALLPNQQRAVLGEILEIECT